jgi:phosphatidylserine/phosphatidylglycerophosphate/cardiolipin synthase-like enzyme
MSAKVTGPILDYLNRNFCQAWDDATGQKLTQARAALACRLKLRPDHGTPVMAQIFRTQSQHGKDGTEDISSLYLQTVNNTTNFVYIEIRDSTRSACAFPIPAHRGASRLIPTRQHE